MHIHNKNRLLSWVLCISFGCAFLVILSLTLARFWPWGADYLYYYYPLAEKWLQGHHDIYDPNISALFYPPWSLLVIVPLGFLPIQLAHGFLLTISMVLILFSIRLLQGTEKFPIYFYLLSLINLHSFDLYIRGQFDGVVLFGIALGYWAIQNKKPLWLSFAFCFMVMKPPLNVFLVVLLYLMSIAKWSKGEIVRVFSLPFAMVIVSSFAVGIDWPIRYVRNMTPTIDYLSISIWKIAKVVNFPTWLLVIIACIMIVIFLEKSRKIGLTLSTLSLALTTTFMFTVYANGDHYVLLIPAFLFVFQRSWKLGLLAYATTFTPLLRLIYGSSVSSVDIIFTTILLISTYMLTEENKHQREFLPTGWTKQAS